MTMATSDVRIASVSHYLVSGRVLYYLLVYSLSLLLLLAYIQPFSYSYSCPVQLCSTLLRFIQLNRLSFSFCCRRRRRRWFVSSFICTRCTVAISSLSRFTLVSSRHRHFYKFSNCKSINLQNMAIRSTVLFLRPYPSCDNVKMKWHETTGTCINQPPPLRWGTT